MNEVTFEQDPFIVVSEPAAAEWAEIERCTIARNGAALTVTLACIVSDTGHRLIIYQTGPRRHFTYRVLQQRLARPGSDMLTHIEVTIPVSTGGATFQDRNGEIAVRSNSPFAEGGDGPFPLHAS